MAAIEDFDRFFAVAYPRLVRQLFAVVGDVGEAEDVVQEAFARAAVRWQRIRGYDNPEGWVRRVALNQARSNLRRTRRTLAALVRVGPAADVPELSPDAMAVAAAMGRLPLRHREVLVLCYVVQLPIGEVAEQLGIPKGTVKAGWLVAVRRWPASSARSRGSSTMRDDELQARLLAYADEGGQPRRPAPSRAELRRRGYRALLRSAVGTVLVVVLVVGGGVVWAGRAGVHRSDGVVNQPRPSPSSTPPVTSPPVTSPPVTTPASTPAPTTSSAPVTTLPAPPPDTPGRLSLGSRVTPTGIGPVQVAMTVPQAERAGGVTLLRTMAESYPRCWYVVPKGWPKAHDLDIVIDRVGLMATDGTIARIDVWAGSTATREGIRIGSTEQEVQRAYPGRITVTHDRFGVRQLIFTPAGLAGAGYRILFESDGRQVTHFRAGKVTQVVDHDEGCA